MASTGHVFHLATFPSQSLDKLVEQKLIIQRKKKQQHWYEDTYTYNDK